MKRKAISAALDQARARHAAGRVDEACAAYDTLLRSAPDHPEALHLRGLADYQRGRLEDAAARIARAAALEPGHAAAHCNLGLVRHAQGRHEDAVACYRAALRLAPRYFEAWLNMGIAHHERGALDEAATSYERAVQIGPRDADAWNRLGRVREQQERLPAALACFEKALALRPDMAAAHANRGLVLKRMGRVDEAIDGYREALRRAPAAADSHLNLGMALLLRGDFAAGWPEYEWRWRCADVPTRALEVPRWQGEPLAGRRILLHAEQGLGDAVQFARYVPEVTRRGGRVIVEVPAPLVRLLESVTGADAVIARGAPLPACDVEAPLMSLPGILGTTLETIPAEVPYLQPPADRVARWSRELHSSEGLRVGLCWQGRPQHAHDGRRSVPLPMLAPLLDVPGVAWYSLQRDFGREQMEGLPIVDLGSRFEDLADTAAACACLDLIVSVDTAPAHVAGALGRPTWLLLPAAPDWRWLLEREDSPWYPTMRLFRQPRAGDWGAVVESLRGKLDSAHDALYTE